MQAPVAARGRWPSGPRPGPQKEPVSPGVAAGLFDVADEQLVVAAVGLPGDIEGVAEERNRADDHVEARLAAMRARVT